MTTVSIVPTHLAITHVTAIFAAIAASQQRQIALFWSIFLALLGALVFLLVWSASRRRSSFLSRLDDLRESAEHTIVRADVAVSDIDQAVRSGRAIQPETAQEYAEAVTLRDSARTRLDRPLSPESLGDANEDAAHAVLVLQGIMRRLNLGSLADAATIPHSRCFYCAQENRPPYTEERIEDGRGHAVTLEVCSACLAQLERGRTPQMATAVSGSVPIPWYAVQGQAWYHAYGGETWQYWLPLLIGMDVAAWFSGGWQYAVGWRDSALPEGGAEARGNSRPVHGGSSVEAGGAELTASDIGITHRIDRAHES